MTINVKYRTKLSQYLNYEDTDTTWSFTVGTGTTVASKLDTSLASQSYVGSAVASNENQTGLFSGFIPGFAGGVDTEDISEFGILDKQTDGILMNRDSGFTPLTGTAGKQILCDKYYEINNDTNTQSDVVTDQFIDEMFKYMNGTGNTLPDYVAFGTHLILDTCDVTNGWIPTGDAGTIGTSSNYIEGTASLVLTKTGGTSQTFGYEKTLGTVVDFTDPTDLRLRLRFNSVDTYDALSGTPVRIKIGNDSSNYKYYDIAKTEIILGWTLNELTVSDFIDVGTPDLSTTDYLAIDIATTDTAETIATDEVLMDIWSGKWDLTSTDNTLHSEVIRDEIDTTTRDDNIVTYDGVIEGNLANTNDLYYLGLFSAATGGTAYAIENIYKIRKDEFTQIDYRVSVGVKINEQ